TDLDAARGRRPGRMVDLPNLWQEQRPGERALLRLRRMAALTGGTEHRGLARPARIPSLALALTMLAALPAIAAAADPSAPPQPRPPTCAERYPEEGPAGVDLRLGCIVSELVGLYRPDQATAPPTIST